MSVPVTQNSLFFLQGGGEMGELTRNYDWEDTSIGSPDRWPQSLRTTLGILLHSRFPMFLFWGPELLCFYNDAYRPSLGNDGKHPYALGKPAEKIWPEIWEFIKPLIEQVINTREATWDEDRLLPIYRNGKLEDVYWTFSYSPVINEEGIAAGVFITCTETTEKVVRTEELKTSKENLSNLIQQAPVAIGLFVGPDLIIEEPNDMFIDIVGKGNDIAGRPLHEVMPELITEGQPFLEILNEVYTKAEPYQDNATFVKVLRDGVLQGHYYDFTYTPLRNDKGEVYAILNIAIDVTPQVLATKVIEESEQNLRNMILQAPVAMCILKGPRYVVQIANDRMYQLWGRDPADLINKPIFDGLKEASGQGLEELLDKVFMTGETYKGYEIPINLPRAGGVETVFVNFVYEAFRESDGHISGVMVVGNDVTDQVGARMKVEENESSLMEFANELKNSKDKLQLAIDVGELGIFEVDLVSNVIYPSPRLNEIFGIEGSNNRGDYAEALHPDDAKLREMAHKKAAVTGLLDYTTRVVWRNQQVHWVRIRGIITFDDNRKPIWMLGIAQDITDQKELEFQKDNFLGVASHELKTPVTSIKVYVQVMEDLLRKAGNIQYADMMGRIDKQVNRLNYLIADLLDVTKINSGKLQFNITTFNFSELVDEVAEDMQRISSRHTIKKNHGFNGDVTTDRERASQVITNLISNAIKYSPDADQINISTDFEHDEVSVCVQDFGIGINPDKQGRVFEQFYRVSGDKEHTFPGLGLGLYISSEIIKRMGGRIWVNSNVDKGSTFCFAFPVKDQRYILGEAK